MSDNLVLREDIWQAQEAIKISYPEEASDDYFKIEENSFWFKHRNNCLLETLKNFPPNGPIYDIGGGNGFVSAHLEKNGFPVTLIEPNMAGAINAKRRGLKTIICAALENSNLPKNSLAGIGIFDVLEHIKDDKKFLAELKDYLKVGGRLYVTVPAYNFLWSADDDYAGHFRRYSFKSLKKVLEEAGFSVDYGTYLFGFLPLPIFIFKSLFYKLGFRKKKTRNASADHGQGGYWLDNIMNWELNRLKNKKAIGLGSSCLVVAQRKF